MIELSAVSSGPGVPLTRVRQEADPPSVTAPVISPSAAANRAANAVRAGIAPGGANLIQAQEARRPAVNELSEEEQRIVRELRQTDAEVRRHELAHRTAGGPYTSAPTYQYVRGPDGKLYAVSGEVSIDVSPESTPQATIIKMDIVIRAALAPTDPSSQDRAVANQAKQLKLQAQAELATQEQEEAAQAAEERRQREAAQGTLDTQAATQAYQGAQDSLAAIAGNSARTAFSAFA